MKAARLGLAITVSALASATLARAPAPARELVLDMTDPIVGVRVAGVALRLRVALDAKRVVELNPAAVARLPLHFGEGFDAQVGRTTLKGIAALATMRVAGRDVPVQLSAHGRDCCAGADGAISPLLLPYALIRFVREDAPAPAGAIALAMTDSEADGLEGRVTADGDTLFVQLALDRAETVATASAGAILAEAQGGRLETGYATTVAAFGIARPTRMLALARPATIAGFRFDRLATRTADFAGDHALPADKTDSGDILVRARVSRQEAWPVILIGRDRLDRCAEIAFDARSRRLTLRCAFE